MVSLVVDLVQVAEQSLAVLVDHMLGIALPPPSNLVLNGLQVRFVVQISGVEVLADFYKAV